MEETCMMTQVKYDDGGDTKIKTQEYKGFWEVSFGRIDKLDHCSCKGLIALQDEDTIRWFVYDRHYLNAIAEFYRYCQDNFDCLPQHRIMDYVLHNE